MAEITNLLSWLTSSSYCLVVLHTLVGLRVFNILGSSVACYEYT